MGDWCYGSSFSEATEFSPRFLRRYADLHTQMMAGIQNYVADVKSGAFPNEQEQY